MPTLAAANSAGTAQPVGLQPLARGPVLGALVALAAALIVTSEGYGYERDELYFRMLRPAWGYIDQPPLGPLLAHGISAVIDRPWAIRLPGTLAVLVAVYVLVLITRELGGDRFAQGLCAWGAAFAALPLALGHVLLTATLDQPVWPAIILFALRAVLRDQPRWWLAAGVVAGLSMYNKLLVAVLIVALAAAIVAVGPRRLLVARYVLGALGLALLVGSPNLIYQATHGFPQFAIGHALEQDNGSDVHTQMWTLLLLMIGPPLVPIWLAGLVSLWRRPAVRFVAAAFPLVLVLVFVMGSQPYYELGLAEVLFAAGCVPTTRWLRAASWRRALVVTVVGLNVAVSAVIGLPIVPAADVGATPIPGVNQVVQDSIGWPTYVDQIAAAYHALPPARRADAVVLASNYGEAGAVDRYGPAAGLPAVYSGQNALWYQARPPADVDVVLLVGGGYREDAGLFTHCRIVARLDNGVDVDNEEQGEPIGVCTDPRGGWSQAWPRVKHLG